MVSISHSKKSKTCHNFESTHTNYTSINKHHLWLTKMSSGYLNIQANSTTQKLENHGYSFQPSNKPVKVSIPSNEQLKSFQQNLLNSNHSYDINNPSNKIVENCNLLSESPEQVRRQESGEHIYHTPSSIRIHQLPSTATLLYMSPGNVCSGKSSKLLRNGLRPRYNRTRIGLYTLFVSLALVIILLVTLQITGLYHFL